MCCFSWETWTNFISYSYAWKRSPFGIGYFKGRIFAYSPKDSQFSGSADSKSEGLMLPAGSDTNSYWKSWAPTLALQQLLIRACSAAAGSDLTSEHRCIQEFQRKASSCAAAWWDWYSLEKVLCLSFKVQWNNWSTNRLQETTFSVYYTKYITTNLQQLYTI